MSVTERPDLTTRLRGAEMLRGNASMPKLPTTDSPGSAAMHTRRAQRAKSRSQPKIVARLSGAMRAAGSLQPFPDDAATSAGVRESFLEDMVGIERKREHHLGVSGNSFLQRPAVSLVIDLDVPAND